MQSNYELTSEREFRDALTCSLAPMFVADVHAEKGNGLAVDTPKRLLDVVEAIVSERAKRIEAVMEAAREAFASKEAAKKATADTIVTPPSAQFLFDHGLSMEDIQAVDAMWRKEMLEHLATPETATDSANIIREP